jgi:hypothetical protein
LFAFPVFISIIGLYWYYYALPQYRTLKITTHHRHLHLLLILVQSTKEVLIMIPSKSDPRWEALVRGDIKPNFRAFSGNMMLSRLSRSLKKDDSSANLQRCIESAYDFFMQFENLFSEELNQIFE